MSTYEVIVGNVGVIYSGDKKHEADHHYNDAVHRSWNHVGRMSGEPVTLMTNGHPTDEYLGDVSEETTDTAQMRRDVEHSLAVMNGVYGKGVILAVVWGREHAGVTLDFQGMVVRQMQYGMDAKPFGIRDGKVVFLKHKEAVIKSETPK